MDFKTTAPPTQDVVRSSLADAKSRSRTCSPRTVYADLPALIEEGSLGLGSMTPPRNKALSAILQQHPFDARDRRNMDSHGNLESLVSHANDALLLPNACDTRCNASLEMDAPPAIASIGSVGHPYSCANACKYLRRKGGCRNGVNCSSCHLCQWCRDAVDKPPVPQFPDDIRQDVMGKHAPIEECLELMEFDDDFSIGTIGHPYTCAIACKYHTKKAGCKEGKLCTRCHSCTWRRGLEKKTFGSAPAPKMPNKIARRTGAHFGEFRYNGTQIDAITRYETASTSSSISNSGVSVASSLEKDVMTAQDLPDLEPWRVEVEVPTAFQCGNPMYVISPFGPSFS